MKKTIAILISMLPFLQLMGNDIIWSFPPTSISTSGVNATSPQIAMDLSGDVVAVWIESNTLKASSKTVSGSWSSISTLSSTAASVPCVVMDPSGNATAIWLESGVVQAATKTLSGSWSSATNVSSSGATAPTLAVDSAGNVTAAWVSSGNILTSTKLFGGSWGSVATISSTAAAAPHIAMGGSGSSELVVVVWHSLKSSVNSVYASTKTLSGTWSTAGLLGGTQTNNAFAYASVDASGNAVAAWFSYGLIGIVYYGVTVESSYRLSGGTWQTPVVLSSPGIVNPANLSLRTGFDSAGNAVALWSTSFNMDKYNIQSSMRPVYGSWSTPADILEGSLYSYGADLAILSSGDAIAASMFYNGSSQLIHSLESDISGFLGLGWSTPITISQQNKVAYPHIAATLSSNTLNAAALWLSYNGTNTSVAASTGSKTLVLPPSALSVTQSSNNFGVFTEYYNTLSWTASTDPTATGYIIYRNGTYLTEVGAGTHTFVDDNQVSGGAVTYGVASVNSNNMHSQIMTVTY